MYKLLKRRCGCRRSRSSETSSSRFYHPSPSHNDRRHSLDHFRMLLSTPTHDSRLANRNSASSPSQTLLHRSTRYPRLLYPQTLEQVSSKTLSGHVGHLNAEQEAKLVEFKTELEAKGYYTPARDGKDASHEDVELLYASFAPLRE